MFNDQFNDRIRRYRLKALLVLAALVLFGLGAGHLATRALGAPPPPALVSATFRDRVNDPMLPDDGLRSDGEGAYVDYRVPGVTATQCVENYVNDPSTGLWRLTTPVGTCSPAPRAFRLVLPGPGPSWVAPDSAFADPSHLLYLGGVPNDVSAQVKAWPFNRDPSRYPTVVYIRTDDTANPGTVPAFLLEYQEALKVTPDPNYPNDSRRRVITTDGGSPMALLSKRTPKKPYWTPVGTYSVPCWIKITLL